MTERLPVSEPPQDRRPSEPAGRDRKPAWAWGPRGLWVLLALVLLLRAISPCDTAFAVKSFASGG